ncbi:1-acyl-sn-glycerol-3-phosphate acyltransferase [bacterium]|nr:1-acyl-sn-glycerol-3-phosphate acyltransferase [bacterium]
MRGESSKVSVRTNPCFAGDRYETPDDRGRDLLDRLGLGSSAWFYTLLLRIVLTSRARALGGSYDDEAWVESSIAVMRALERCGARFHIEGIDHIRRLEEPVVFVSNHMSTVETMVFPCLIVPFRPVTFVVKKDLTTMPLFGPIMRSRDPVTVGRENPREDMQTVLGEGQRRLEDGVSVILFPQSTRRVDLDPEHFNSLGVKLARRAGVKVLPVAIKTDFWRAGRLVKDLGPLDRSQPIHMRFGAPMAIEGPGRAEHQAIVSFIQENLARWQG